jgi:hypothetical protein
MVVGIGAAIAILYPFGEYSDSESRSLVEMIMLMLVHPSWAQANAAAVSCRSRVVATALLLTRCAGHQKALW